MHEIVSRFCGLPVEHGQKIDFGFSAVERRDQRLDHRDRAVIAPRVAPGFQFVRLRNVPVAQRRGFVFIQPEARAERHLRQNFLEAQIGGRVIDRIAAQNQQRRDASRANIRREFADGIPLVRRADLRSAA